MPPSGFAPLGVTGDHRVRLRPTTLASKYGLQPGDPVNLVLSSNDQVTMRLTGIFDLGSAGANERAAFTGPQLPRQILGLPRRPVLGDRACSSSDPFAGGDGRRRSGACVCRGVKVTDWQADNKDLLAALQSQSSSSYMIQVFVLIAVALGIASTLAISAVQKTRQIGILKALGMSDARHGARSSCGRRPSSALLGTAARRRARAGCCSPASPRARRTARAASPSCGSPRSSRSRACVGHRGRDALVDHPDAQDGPPRPDRGDPEWLSRSLVAERPRQDVRHRRSRPARSTT